jgi:thymidine kinase
MRVSVYCSSSKEIPQHSLDLAFENGVAIGGAEAYRPVCRAHFLSKNA